MKNKSERAGGRAVVLVVLALALLVAGGWGAAYAVAGDKVPRGTTVAGVDVGGRTQADAVRALEDGLAERLDQPIAVTVGDTTEDVTPADAGLSVDLDASVEAAGGGRSWKPGRLWDYFTGGEDLDPIVQVDDATMGELLDRLGAEAGTLPKDGGLSFEGSGVTPIDPEVGEAIDPDVAAEAITAAYLADEPTVELELVEAQPDIDDADVQAALDDFANPALSGPVTLVFGDSPVRLAPRDFSAALGVRAEGGVLVPDIDEKALTALVDDGIAERGAPVDATVVLRNGKPKVVPAKPGVTYEPADVAAAFLALLTKPEGERQQEVEATVDEPEFSTKDARQLRIREKVSTFTTYYPPASYRDTNIGRAAELVDGTVLKPGETFSLNDIVGERTVENGFTTGTIISNGIFKEDLGGGVSQMATTTFNAAFFAGLKDVEHKPHSVYIDRYPVGREATVAWGAVDLRFTNDTPYGVLIHANVIPSAGRSQGTVTVSMWSTKVWDITTTTSGRYNTTAPKTRTLTTPDCLPNNGYSGFDVDVKRFFAKPGSDTVEKTENFHTTYIPSDTVVCKKPGEDEKPEQ
ncbi:VanW family protein [Nocardioides lianchengensis]|uniref:Vancomycin resistance protein YoaR, contains peptidoglycan-binding and VanW domains n=1 Tax=Nocardioides lianchengensis TaxID=1045774 RepID=A0A1G6UZY1_9ACTN|nr:VanW family protein [Nocardioides lianchengensis]NYG11074.1 vancomycin resistance protein YoaR [Nocardioides lianchengensis]SDD46206.1 Vancomycin resistance protein YoaR, contains peptidoglycan-binding and VanW domains [Nocardioides lianchengensis]